MKFVEGCSYETNNTKEIKKERKEEAKAEEVTAEEEELEASVPLVTHINNILNSIYSIVEVYINN